MYHAVRFLHVSFLKGLIHWSGRERNGLMRFS